MLFLGLIKMKMIWAEFSVSSVNDTVSMTLNTSEDDLNVILEYDYCDLVPHWVRCWYCSPITGADVFCHEGTKSVAI